MFNPQSPRITTNLFSDRNSLTGLTLAFVFSVDFVLCGKKCFYFFENLVLTRFLGYCLNKNSNVCARCFCNSFHEGSHKRISSVLSSQWKNKMKRVILLYTSIRQRRNIRVSSTVRGTVGKVVCGTPLRGLEITLFQAVIVGADTIFHCV